MANEKQVERLKQEIEGWNAWRYKNKDIKPDLSRANLTDANLIGANLTGALLSRADLTGATLGETIFGNINLTKVIGLETCRHFGPSTIDFRTLAQSGPLPFAFLRGVGSQTMLSTIYPLC